MLYCWRLQPDCCAALFHTRLPQTKYIYMYTHICCLLRIRTPRTGESRSCIWQTSKCGAFFVFSNGTSEYIYISIWYARCGYKARSCLKITPTNANAYMCIVSGNSHMYDKLTHSPPHIYLGYTKSSSYALFSPKTSYFILLLDVKHLL